MTLKQADNSNHQRFLPKISVIVPVYNGEADLPDLLGCLQAQTYPADLVEYLLVDNGSRDRTVTLLQTAVQEAASLGITLRYLQENEIQSSYAARNTGIRAAMGDILAFTDADCRPQPDWLDALIPPFADSGVGVVVGEIVAVPGKTLLEKHADRHNVLSQQHTLNHAVCPYGQTANLAIRRQVLEQVGLFRPYLNTGGDADMCWRIQRGSDWQLHFAPTAVVRHRHRSTLQEYQSQWRRYGRSNRYLHELHGVQLMREMTNLEYLHRLGRWLVKEVPINSMKAIARKTAAIDIISTPIGLFGAWARAAGQREAQLPEKAREIEWLQNAQRVGSNQHHQ
jgi:cellulose synthase/poly-beta-1,6-N-acetylglucosamine synthase-like glycosyltransferase